MLTNGDTLLKWCFISITALVLVLGATGAATPASAGQSALTAHLSLNTLAGIGAQTPDIQHESRKAETCVVEGAIRNSDPTQYRNVRRNGSATTCQTSTSCEPQGNSDLHYDAYTFTNTTGQTTCVTVALQSDCDDGAREIYSVAYLDSFDPDNVCANYLADMGSTVSNGTYSFNVPAGRSIVVVVQETEEGQGCDYYSLTVSSLICGLPATPSPTRTLTATRTSSATRTPASTHTSTAGAQTSTRTSIPALTSTYTTVPVGTATNTPGVTSTHTSTPLNCMSSGLVTGSIANSDAVMVGRLNRDGLASSCQVPKSCPSVLGNDALHYDSYSYANAADLTQCFTVRIDAGACTGQRYIFSAAYLGSFDPNNLCANYLADIGISPNPLGSYSFSVPPGASFVVLVHELSVGTGCPGYALTVTNCPTNITNCAITFSDVPPEQTFYPYVHCLACGGILSGYADGTFRPGNNLTRAQLAKIVSNSAGFNDPPAGQLFQDIPPSHAFYVWVQRLANREYINGYPCGGLGEPCGPGNLPYFRPGNNATRAQISKIVSNAAGFNDPPAGQIFQDVLPASTFYVWIQRLASRNIMGGYPCGGPGEPCRPGNRPYFRPNNNSTRGQASKIVGNTFFPDCYTTGVQDTGKAK